MWLQTVDGFYSVVQKPGEAGLTVRARARADLERLRGRYLPSLEIRVEGGDYPYRASVTHQDFAEALGRMALDIDYSNFKSEVQRRRGRRRHDVYAKVWDVLHRITREEERS